MERLQGRGAARTTVRRQADPPLGQPACLRVQLHARRVLDALEVPSLLRTDCLDAVSVQQGNPHGVSPVGTAEGLQEVIDQPLRRRSSTRAATAMESHLPAADVPPHSGVGREGHPLRL